MEKLDFLIVGQGIAGTLLSHELLKEGQRIKVIDSRTSLTSSNKAAGLYNPITGRKMKKTWLADELFPSLETYYQELQQDFDEAVIFPKTIYRPFHGMEELNDWESKAYEPGFKPFIKDVKTKSQSIHGIIDPFGGIMLNLCGYVDMPRLVNMFRKKLENLNAIHYEDFAYEQLKISDTSVSYKHFEANKIIFCEGPGVIKNPLWNYLPFRPVKGEIMDIKADLPEDKIINRGVFMLPRGGVFRIGSTYDHEHLDFEPTKEGIITLKKRLNKLYEGNYEVVGHSAGVRPATYDRRPFIGIHTEHKPVGIFNGFGTKGVSLVPYFARQYVSYLLHQGHLNKEVDIQRV